jgi:serine/threonine-protein kinase
MLDSRGEASQNVTRVTTEQNVTRVTTEQVSETNESLVGTVLADRYRIERLLGAGGMGAVYRAEHVLMRKACAVKVLHREMTQVREVVARFEREAVAAARIEHPNVAAATDFGQLPNGSFYLVLEFIEGTSLSQQIAERGAMPEQRALLIARQIAEALAAAHAAGVVHRDLKPDNVMLVARDGMLDFVKVLDFGIAKVQFDTAVSEQQALTRMNTVMGTPEYMSPEQARGEPVDHRADIYAVGAILYEMLLGTSPFRSDDMVVALTRKLTEDAPALPARISEPTRKLVARLLERQPEARPQSASELVFSIDGVLGFAPPVSLGFAPLSAAQSGAPSARTAGEASVAYANTMLGVTSVTRAAAVREGAVSLLAQLKALAVRPIQLGTRQVPIGLVGGALFSLPVVIALVVSFSTSSASGGATGGASEQAAAAQAPDPLQDLMRRASSGDRPALAELLSRAEKVNSAAVYRALGRGYFQIGQTGAGLGAYASAAKLDTALASDSDVVSDVWRATSDPTQQSKALEVATLLGAAGADIVYRVWEDTKTRNPALAKQAKALLDSEPVYGHASAALKLVLDLNKAKAAGCSAVKKLLPRIAEAGDARAVPLLARMNERRGCGFLGLRDCYGCLRSGKDLKAAQESAAARPAPSFGS